jgi:hypothetical protein
MFRKKLAINSKLLEDIEFSREVINFTIALITNFVITSKILIKIWTENDSSESEKPGSSLSFLANFSSEIVKDFSPIENSLRKVLSIIAKDLETTTDFNSVASTIFLQLTDKISLHGSVEKLVKESIKIISLTESIIKHEYIKITLPSLSNYSVSPHSPEAELLSLLVLQQFVKTLWQNFDIVEPAIQDKGAAVIIQAVAACLQPHLLVPLNLCQGIISSLTSSIVGKVLNGTLKAAFFKITESLSAKINALDTDGVLSAKFESDGLVNGEYINLKLADDNLIAYDKCCTSFWSRAYNCLANAFHGCCRKSHNDESVDVHNLNNDSESSSPHLVDYLEVDSPLAGEQSVLEEF